MHMDYDERVIIRPPSEAVSLLLPVTIGCSHNQCTFCGTYKNIRFQVLKLEGIKADIDKVAGHYGWSVQRVFLENGDALAAPQSLLVEVLKYFKQRFPRLERVGTYATPRDALLKTVNELKELHDLGLKIAYLGVESGDEDVLMKVKKGATHAQIVEAGRKLKEAGITTSVTVILGLGGVEGGRKHALETARILTEIDPDYAGALTLMLYPGSPLQKDHAEGKFSLISPFQALEELKTIIENAHFTDCFFTANHASNYLPIKARLPEQRVQAVRLIEDILAKKDMSRLRPEYSRLL